MLVLQEVDLQLLKELSKEVAEEGPESEGIYQKLKQGYEAFGTDELVEKAPSRPEFFKTTYAKLLANVKFAGKKSEEVFTESRQHIANTLNRLGIPSRDLEDVASVVIIKMWRHKHAEKYNPLITTWSHHVFVAISRAAASYYQHRKRSPLLNSFHYQQFEGKLDMQGEEAQLDPYEYDQGLSPEQRLVLEEHLMDFEHFLEGQSPYREGVIGRHKKKCTLLPGGHKKAREAITAPMEAYVVREGDQNIRVELRDGSRRLWLEQFVSNKRPNEELSSMAPVNSSEVILRTPLILYKLLMQKGAQVEEIASALKVGPSTAHNWIRDLEVLFQKWWQESPLIRKDVKHLVFPIRKCPGCGYDHEKPKLPGKTVKKAHRVVHAGAQHWKIVPPGTQGQDVSMHWCSVCEEWALDDVPEETELLPPWGKIRGDHDLVERAAKYKNKLEVQRCGL